MISRIKGYYFITDSGLSRSGNIEDVKAAVRSGVKVVQYRNKHASSRQMFVEALQLRDICKDIVFIVNDRVDIALAVGADGVHLGQDDLPCPSARRLLGKSRLIGVTVRTIQEAEKALADGADYIAAAPVFATSTKTDAGKPVGTGFVRELKKVYKVPVAAIGGITLENAKSVVGAGADSICAISCVVTKEDAAAEIRKFQKLFARQ